MLYRISGGRPPNKFTRDIITKNAIVVRAPDGFQWSIGKSISFLQGWCAERKMKVELIDARTV